MHVVKRKGHREKFDDKKLYASVYAACVLTESMPEKQCEKIAAAVSKDVKRWIANKKEVNSNDIAKQVTQILARHHKDAAFMYETHLDVS